MALLNIKASFWGLRRQMEALVGRKMTDNAIQQAGTNGGASFPYTFAPLSPNKSPVLDTFLPTKLYIPPSPARVSAI
jgi:hypothetical protein